MKAKLKEHNSDIQLNHGSLGYSDTRKHLEVGQTYDVVVDMHEWHTNYCINGRAFNSVCFEAVEGETADDVNDSNGLPKKLAAIIADTPNAFVVRIGTDPRTTDQGIANVIPQGVDRDNRDRTIAIANRSVKCWNEHDSLKAKSDLVDELVEALGWLDNAMVDDSRIWIAIREINGCKEWADKLHATLAKAKEAK